MRRAQTGLTLVEFSIALVVLGLIAGGIITGQNMVRASQLTSILSEANSYKQAVSSFRSKYSYLPGDLPNATSYWDVNASCGASSTVLTRLTCNGDGDGIVYYTDAEPFLFWQHLSNAGMVTQVFTGLPDAGGGFAPGSNSPTTKLPLTSWQFGYFGNAAATTVLYDGPFEHAFFFGLVTVGATKEFLGGSVLTPTETWNIDKKIDDGLPGQGNVQSWKSSVAPDCTTTDVITTAAYNLTFTGPACSLVFKSGS